MDGFLATFNSVGANPGTAVSNQFISFGSMQGLNHQVNNSHVRAITFPFPVVLKRLYVNISTNNRNADVQYSVYVGVYPNGTDYATILVPANTLGPRESADVNVLIPANTEIAFRRYFFELTDPNAPDTISNTPCMATFAAVDV